jgi:hypothetical protein
MWIRALAYAVAMMLPVSAIAEDRVVNVTSVEAVATLLKEAGYKAEIKKGDDGAAYIVSAADGSNFQLDFYGCTNDKGCDSFEFYSWYKKEPFFSVAMANEWNVSKRFLKVAIDKDGDLAEYLYVSALGNMTFDNFKDYIDWYATMDASLDKFLDEKRAAAKSGK